MVDRNRYQKLVDRALAAYRTGNLELTLDLAQQCVRLSRDRDFSGHTVLGEALARSGRNLELTQFLDSHPAFLQDPRGKLIQARHLRQLGQTEAAVPILLQILNNPGASRFHRPIAFDLCRVYEDLGRYDDAWDQAKSIHQQTTRDYPIDSLVEMFRVMAEASVTELRRLPQASTRAERTACLLGLPRTGTTILEQALDRHSSIRGVGELRLPGEMCDQIALEGGGWPLGATRVSQRTLDRMQKEYLLHVRETLKTPQINWTLDKTLWPMMQPLFLNAVLPGAKVIRTLRDPRDTAVSIFLSNMEPSWGWAGSLDSIHQAIAAERKYVPIILEKLNIEHIDISMEELVQDPEVQLRKALDLLRLDWEPTCLQPEKNDRLVLTLSYQQVRQPINRNGIGRSVNYLKYFDDRWKYIS